jgi:hypothetical protein
MNALDRRTVSSDQATIAEVDAVHKAMRHSIRPLDHGVLGIYRLSAITGTLAAALAAGAQVYQFKWTDATKLAVLLKLRTTFLPLTPFTAATLTDHTSFDAFRLSSFALGGGGTSISGASVPKTRTAMGNSLAAINIATTAALTAATTLDAQAFAQSIRKGNRVNPAAATEEVLMPQWFDGLDYNPDLAAGEHPQVFAQNEGFVIRNRTVWPAAGTGILLVETVHAEVAAY